LPGECSFVFDTVSNVVSKPTQRGLGTGREGKG
jgi:hypothetical protein